MGSKFALRVCSTELTEPPPLLLRDWTTNSTFSDTQYDTDTSLNPTRLDLPDSIEDKRILVNPWTDPASFPDGGSKAWLAVAGCSACLFVSFGWVNCVGTFQSYYQENQLRGYSSAEIAWIPALQGKLSVLLLSSTPLFVFNVIITIEL